MKHKILVLSISIFALTFLAQITGAQSLLRPGDPDPTFGANGRVLTENQNSDFIWFGDMILQSDNKIVVLSTGYYARHSFHYHFILTRYNSDGTLDNSFGEGGIKYLPIETDILGIAYAKSLYLQPDGKIIIAGNIDYDFGILRVNPNGDLDYTFGENGMVRTDFAGFEEISQESFRDLIVRPDGKILAYGYSEFQSAINPCSSMNPCPFWSRTWRLAIAQYNSEGSLDMSFGEYGLQKYRFTNSQEFPGKMFLQPDGRILLTGTFVWLTFANGYPEYQNSAGIVRYDPSGTVDRDFGKDGFSEMRDYGDFYVPLPDGKILGVAFCASCTFNNYNTNTKILRYNADLTLDTSFPIVRHFIPADSMSGVNLQADGKIICSTTGYNYNSPNPQSTIYRFNSDGTPDFPFGTDGWVKYDLDNSVSIGSSIYKTLIQPDGKILFASKFYPSSGQSGAVGVVIMRVIGRSTKFGS
jgi:uncharacterized delta-60 repeat protein